MQIFRVGIVFAFLVLQIAGVQSANAASPSVVISQLQTAGAVSGTAGQEFVEIYNNSDVDIDVTGWYLTYSSASDASQSLLYKVATVDAQTAVWLKAKSHALFVSPDYRAATGVVGDGTFLYANGMAATAGHVRLYSAQNVEIDKVAWGATTVTPPESTASAPQGGKSLQRVGAAVLQDTDDNSVDFILGTPLLHTSGLYEVVTIVDVCANIDGAQAVVPTGMIGIGDECIVDECPNIDGIQSEVPYGNAKDSGGNCIYDACLNVAGIQEMVPIGYESPDSYNCYAKSYKLEITELFPNPEGDDSGNEFIEIYNPYNFPINIAGYVIYVGSDFEKQYNLPDSMVPALGYMVMKNSSVGFSLVNTQSRAQLVAPDGNTVSETPLYVSAEDGESWAIVDGVWQFTNQPTPGEGNRVSLSSDDDSDVGVTAGLVSCATGKYRHPLTNRCRNIASDVAVISTCDADQFRNPETGRCKKITTAVAAPCKDGQYRSEETNRCRNIATASTQKPCKDNQYRSEETGRCRNLTASSVPASSFAVQPIKDGAMVFAGWWALGGVGLLAAGYAGWEWRNEILAGIRKFASLFSGTK